MASATRRSITVASPKTVSAAAGAAAARSLPSRPGGRRPELDVMRALVVAGLVVFHSAMVFAVGTSWFVKDPRPSIGFSVFLLWGSLWGMPLLFLVSGMGVRHAMRSRTAWAFATERLGRLGIPFLTGLVLLVPPMFYLGQLAQPGFHQPYGRFWLAVLNVPGIARGLLPHGNWTSGGVGFDPAHLWFLYVLLVFSLALLPLFWYLRGQHGTRLAGRVAKQAARHPLAMLATAAVPMIVTETVFGPDGSTGGWERLAYVFPFLYGFLIASDARFESALSRVRWPAVAVAAAATIGLLGWAVAAGPGVVSGAEPGWSALQGLAGWAWLAAIVGFVAAFTARRQTSTATPRPAPAREPPWQRAARYTNQAVLPFYLLHEPVIVAAAWIIVRWHAPIGVKYPALVAVSFTATLALYELAVRRYRPTRFLFGMKPASTPRTGRPPQTSAAEGVMPNLPDESQDRSHALSQGSQNVG
ncbi:MAG TPA: acyltransferase [Streptosporangiaceae bacterium]|nr:acyltransferase [Streptosporangiaceae bacterium]